MTDCSEYDHLLNALYKRLEISPAGSDDLRFDLAVNGIQFSLLPSSGPDGSVDGVAVFGNVGVLPDTGRAEAAIRLLESNLHMAGTGAPFFCCHTERPGHVILCGRMPLHQNDPDKTLEALSLMGIMVEETREWLKPITRSPGVPA